MHTTDHAMKTKAADGYADAGVADQALANAGIKVVAADAAQAAPPAGAEHRDLMADILAGLDTHAADDGSQDDGSGDQAAPDDGSGQGDGSAPQGDGSQPDDGSGQAPDDGSGQGDGGQPDDGSGQAPDDGSGQGDGSQPDDGSGQDDGGASDGGGGGGGGGGGSPVAPTTPTTPTATFATHVAVPMVAKIGLPRQAVHPLSLGGFRPANIGGTRPIAKSHLTNVGGLREKPRGGIRLADDDGYGPYEAPANMGDMGADIFATLLHPLKPMAELVHPPSLVHPATPAAAHPATPVRPAAPAHVATFGPAVVSATHAAPAALRPFPGLHIVPQPGALSGNTGIAGGVAFHPAHPVGHGSEESAPRPTYGQRVGVAFREKPVLFLIGLAAVMYFVFLREDSLWSTIESTGGKTRKHDKVETFTEEIHTKRESVLGKPTFPAPVAAS